MKPIKFPEANLELGKPIDWNDKDCQSLPAYGGYDHNNRPYVNSMWQPTIDDIKAILAGRPVMMGISTPHNHVPPASVFTYNKEGQYNEKDYDAEEMAKLKELLNGLGEIEAQNNRACDTLSELCKNPDSFTMRVPVDEKDTYTIIGKALANNKKLIQFIRAFYEG